MNVDELEKIFLANKNEENAEQMKKYLRNKFEFLGIKKPQREQLEKTFINENKNKDINEILDLVQQLHKKEYREYMYTAQILLLKVYKRLSFEDIKYVVYLSNINPWWENTDGYNAIIKRWLKINLHLIEDFIDEFYNNDSFWLRRSAIICQLSLKEQTNTIALEKAIAFNSKEDEFFIQKAIGWVLRDYSKTNSKYVVDILQKYDKDLTNLAKREASKYL